MNIWHMHMVLGYETTPHTFKCVLILWILLLKLSRAGQDASSSNRKDTFLAILIAKVFLFFILSQIATHLIENWIYLFTY